MHWARFLAAALILLGMGVARADVAISTRPTQNMTCSGGVCTPTAKKAVLNVNDLATMLASGDATVQSGSLAKDIEIGAALSWTSTHRMTLDSYHSIVFNKGVVIAGTGALTITTNHGGQNGDSRFFGKGHVEFWDLSSSLIINGQSYSLEKKINALARDIKNHSTGNYALAKSLNEKNHQYFSSPIPAFSGNFEGLGNTISNLTIHSDSGSQVGLFGELLSSAVIRDLGLTAVNIGGGAGQAIGALVGYSVSHPTVKNVYATGSISGEKDSAIGGLVGVSTFGSINNSYADVSVSAGDGAFAAGGLVGFFEGDPGDVIDRSYATGPVSGGASTSVGGLVGINSAAISNSYATGTVTGGDSAIVGGLIGQNADSDFATVPVLSDAYSTGPVSGGSGAIVGGLIGQDAADSQITNSYWDMNTSGVSNPAQGAGNVQNDPGITGLTTEQFKSGLPAGFSPAIWKEKANINNGYPYLMDLPPGRALSPVRSFIPSGASASQ